MDGWMTLKVFPCKFSKVILIWPKGGHKKSKSFLKFQVCSGEIDARNCKHDIFMHSVPNDSKSCSDVYFVFSGKNNLTDCVKVS